MTPEVIVIVENENATARIAFAREVRGREATDSCADDQQIDLSINRQLRNVEARSIASRMRSNG